MIRPSSPLTMLLSRHTRRREFITLLGGAAAAWPLAARAQQAGADAAHRRASCPHADDAEYQARVGAFLQGLQQLGWTDRPQRADRHPLGRGQCRRRFANTRRNWSRSRRTSSWPMAASTVGALLQATRTVPIVFAVVADPVGAGFVDSLARPGGNATGFHRRSNTA